MAALRAHAGRWRCCAWPCLARRLRADVVHSNSLHSWYGWAVALLVGRAPRLARPGDRLPVCGRPCGWSDGWPATSPGSVIAVSAAVAAQLRPRQRDRDHRRGGWLAVPGRSGPGDFGHAPASRDAVPLVGSVARIDTWKGFEVLLDAFPAIRAARPQVELVIAGGPVAGKEEYAAAAGPAGRKAWTECTGWDPAATSATLWPISTCSSRCRPNPSRSGWWWSRLWPPGFRSWPERPADRWRSCAGRSNGRRPGGPSGAPGRLAALWLPPCSSSSPSRSRRPSGRRRRPRAAPAPGPADFAALFDRVAAGGGSRRG